MLILHYRSEYVKILIILIIWRSKTVKKASLFKKMLSLILTLVMVFTMIPAITFTFREGSTAAAFGTYTKAHTKEWYYASGTTFIKSMAAGYDGSKLSTVISQMKDAGYTNVKNLSGGDMDTAAGISKADYTTVGYNTTNNPAEAITGCLFSVTRDGSSHSGTITTNPYNYEGSRVSATFKQVNGANSSGEPSYRDGDCDLNRNGSGAAWCYFYVTRTYDFGPPVTDVRIESSTGTLTNNGYTLTYSVQAPTTPADSTYGKGSSRYVGFKSSCTAVNSDTLRSNYSKGLSYYNNASRYVSVSSLSSALTTAENILKDLADGYTTSNQTAINNAATAITNALNALQTTVTLNPNGGYRYRRYGDLKDVYDLQDRFQNGLYVQRLGFLHNGDERFHLSAGVLQSHVLRGVADQHLYDNL